MSLAGRLHVGSRLQGPELFIANRCRSAPLATGALQIGVSLQCVRERVVSSSAINGGATAPSPAPAAPVANHLEAAPQQQEQLQQPLQPSQAQLQQQLEPASVRRPRSGQPAHQQQQVEQLPGTEVVEQPEHPAIITAAIKHARSIEQLQDAVQRYGKWLNHIHVSAAFVQLQRLWTSSSNPDSRNGSSSNTADSDGNNSSWSRLPPRQPPRTALLLQLLQLAQSLQRVDGRYCANVLYSLAVIEQQGEPAAYCAPLVDQLCAASFELVNSMPPQELATLVWSLAVLDIMPAPQLLQRLVANILRRLQAFTAQDIAMTLSGLPKLSADKRVSPYHTVHKLAAAAARQMQAASPLECALLLSSLAAVTYRPDATWLSNYYASSEQKLVSMGAAELGMTGWALGQMSPLAQQPAAAWVGNLQHALASKCIHGRQHDQQSQFNSSSRRTNSRSSSSNAVQPPAAFVELVMGLYGWSKAAPGQPPTADFQQLLFSSTQQLFDSDNSSSSSLTLQQQRQQQRRRHNGQQQQHAQHDAMSAVRSFAQQQFLQQQGSSDHQITGQGVSPMLLIELLAAAARWQIMPPRPWLLSVLGQLQQQLVAGTCSTKDISNCLWALATLCVKPTANWLDCCTAALQRQLEQQQRQRRRQQLVDRPWRQEGGLSPSPTAAAAGSVDANSAEANLAKQLAVSLWALHKLQHTVSSSGFWGCLWPVSEPMLSQQFRLTDIAMLLEGAAQQQQQPPAPWLKLALAAAVRKAAGAAAELQQQQQPGTSSRSEPQPNSQQQQQEGRQRQRQRRRQPGVLLSSAAGVGVDMLRVCLAGVRLGAAPGHKWCCDVVKALRPAAEQLDCESICKLVWCLGKLGYRPSGSSLTPWLAAAVARQPLQQYSSSSMSMLLSGLKGCRVVMSARWMAGLLQHSQAHAAEWPLEVVIQLVLYVSSCRSQPPADWLAAMAQALETTAAKQQQQQPLDAKQLRLRALLIAMVKLQIVPRQQFMQQLETAAAAAASASSAAEGGVDEGRIHEQQMWLQRLQELQQSGGATPQSSMQLQKQKQKKHAKQQQLQQQHQELSWPMPDAETQADQGQQQQQQQQQQFQQQQSGATNSLRKGVNGAAVTDLQEQLHSRQRDTRQDRDSRTSDVSNSSAGSSSEWPAAVWVAGKASSSAPDTSAPAPQRVQTQRGLDVRSRY